MTERDEHLEWAKGRALQYVVLGDLNNAFASLASDLQKDPTTANHPGIAIGAAMLVNGLLSTAEQMRQFIAGFR